MDHTTFVAALGADPETLSVLGPTIRILAEFGTSDDDPCLISGEMGPGVAVPLHSHADREHWYVARGTVQAYRDGDGWIELPQGSSFSIVDGVRHALRNPSDAPVGMIVLTTARMARFFRLIGTPPDQVPPGPPTPEALGRFVAASERFGFWLGRPDENAGIGLSLG